MKHSLRITLIAGAGIILLAMYYLFDPVASIWTPKCPFRVLTGWQCPGCGLQRALHSLLQGNPWEAIRYNYFLLLAGPYVVLFGIRTLMPQGKARERLTKRIEDRRVVRLYVITFGVWLVVRNILHI